MCQQEIAQFRAGQTLDRQGQVFVESLPHHAGYPKDNMNRVTNPCCFLAAQQHHFTVHLFFFFLPLSAFEFETARRRPAAAPWKEGGKASNASEEKFSQTSSSSS